MIGHALRPWKSVASQPAAKKTTPAEATSAEAGIGAARHLPSECCESGKPPCAKPAVGAQTRASKSRRTGNRKPRPKGILKRRVRPAPAGQSSESIGGEFLHRREFRRFGRPKSTQNAMNLKVNTAKAGGRRHGHPRAQRWGSEKVARQRPSKSGRARVAADHGRHAMAGRTFASAQRGKRQPANPSPPSPTTGACPKTSKVDGSVNKRRLTPFLRAFGAFQAGEGKKTKRKPNRNM